MVSEWVTWQAGAYALEIETAGMALLSHVCPLTSPPHVFSSLVDMNVMAVLIAALGSFVISSFVVSVLHL